MRLVLGAVVLVAVVLGLQVSAGGGDFVGLGPVDPCTPRAQGELATQLEPLAEQIVLAGIDETACGLGMSRERLVLVLGDPGERRTVDPEALRAGMLRAVDRLAGRLPPVSELAPDAVERSNLPGLVKRAVSALPASTIDDLLATDTLLKRAIGRLDFATALNELQDPAALDSLLREAVIEAAREEVIEGLPGPVRGILG